MARLIVEHNSRVLKDYSFGKKSVTVGRSGDNTIVLDDLAVSGYHARVDKKGVDYILTDLQSTNGTFLNNASVVSHRLTHGDRIVMGEHTLLFVGTEMAKIYAEEEKLDLNKTTIRGKPEKRSAVFRPFTIERKETAIGKTDRSPRRWRAIPVLSTILILIIGLWVLLNQNTGLLRGLASSPMLSETNSTFRPISKSGLNEVESISTIESVANESFPQTSPDQDWAFSDLKGETPPDGMHEPMYMLEGIVLASESQDSFAVINGHMVRSGETVGKARITEIGRNYVVVQSLNDESEIRLTLRR
ncbi:MAG: FHA domain-containing protein [Deltaproteobacteria bacterium]|nr:FHA domain-containing protein [Deltaproteobacteria bacterium]